MNDTPLIAAPLYGLRTWRWTTDVRGECLTGAYRRTPWASDGAWVHAVCAGAAEHAAPDPDCACGLHGWHPDRSSARRVLASRFDVPGVIEAAGAVEVHEDGFRAERARPYALVVTPGRNAKLVARLGARYRAQVVEVDGPDALLAWCRERGLGLDAGTVEQILGPGHAGARREERRRRRRRDVVGATAALALAASGVLLGAQFAAGPPSSHGVYGRTGWVKPPKQCPTRPPPRGRAVAPVPAPPPPHRC